MSCYGNSRSHHFQQHLDAPAFIQPFERSNESGESAGQDTDVLSSSKIAIQSRDITIRAFDQRLDDAGWHRNRSTILMCENTRHANGAAYRQPTITIEIENDEKVARKKGRLHAPQLT